MRIGKIVKSNTHIDYVCQVYSPGEIVDTEGRVMGAHQGLHLYTLGQRKGHGVASPREGMAYVVVGKDLPNNRLIVGWEQVNSPAVATSSLTTRPSIDPSVGSPGKPETST